MKSVADNAALSGQSIFSKPVGQLFDLFDMPAQIPSIVELNQWRRDLDKGADVPEFVSEETINAGDKYYEMFIAEHHQVPTRENNWHDAFNAMMWMLFPSTKRYLNALHCADIKEYGLNPRTPKRNRLTHFDECGLVIAVPEDKLESANELLTKLASHHWNDVMVTQAAVWQQQLMPFIFGHALYEMLLNPFIGLTGKWLAVVVPSDFSELSASVKYQVLDKALMARIEELNGLADKGLLKPIPLLGIPGWHTIQDENFYANTDYFRPLAKHSPTTRQLPLARSN